MKQIRISDVTMKQTGADISLSFREKIELSKLLDKLGVTVIELEPLVQAKIDALRIKSVAAAVKNSIVAINMGVIIPHVISSTHAIGLQKSSPAAMPKGIDHVRTFCDMVAMLLRAFVVV